MMNSGLPSLLDAIFGKQDLALVSLDEIYEVIREFPSFNAGHFLLAKKLKLQEDPGYEMESMRTALYFNNPFWLQSLLDDGNHFHPTENVSYIKEAPDEDLYIFEEHPEETTDVIETESNYTFESYTPIEQPATEKDELDEETEEILDEKYDSDPVRSTETFQYAEPGSQTVTSFDELMAKYHLQPLDMVDETAVPPESVMAPETAVAPEIAPPAKEDVQSEPEAIQDFSLAAAEPDTDQSTVDVQDFSLAAAEPNTDESTTDFQNFNLPTAEAEHDKNIGKISDQDEGLEEVVNEYGIFEEKVSKKADQDMDAFDEPLDQIPFVSDKIVEETTPVAHAVDIEVVSATEHIIADDDTVDKAEEKAAENVDVVEYDNITENQESENAPHKTDEHDYDSFDRPVEEPVETELPVSENESSHELPDYDPDNTGEPVAYSDDSETGANGQMQELSERFEEHQKSVSAFNAKNADSIVFTPYHMVDYFASQGIKLVLEDNPPDQFGKQLKSFTDWLKVMKKLPLKHSPGKEDEKENERIRHFAAHSIEERDVLTESMAEVLAKQGMYENAIALFQKLSLIYPPKSAYFASRIEQLKASLS